VTTEVNYKVENLVNDLNDHSNIRGLIKMQLRTYRAADVKNEFSITQIGVYAYLTHVGKNFDTLSIGSVRDLLKEELKLKEILTKEFETDMLRENSILLSEIKLNYL